MGMMAVSVIHPITLEEAMIDAANIAAPVTAEVKAHGRALMNRPTMRKPPERTSRALGGRSGVVTERRLEVAGDGNGECGDRPVTGGEVRGPEGSHLLGDSLRGSPVRGPWVGMVPETSYLHSGHVDVEVEEFLDPVLVLGGGVGEVLGRPGGRNDSVAALTVRWAILVTLIRARSRWIGNTVIITAALLFLAVIVSIMRWGVEGNPDFGTIPLLYAVVGGLVLRHSARNPIGILMAVMGVVTSLGAVADSIALHGAVSGFSGELAAWVRGWYFFVFLGGFIPLFHVFPTGRPLPGVWRWWYRSALLGVGMLVFSMMFGPSDVASETNPFEVPLLAAVAPVIGPAMGLLMIAGLVTAVLSLGVRFRRSRGREREQLKWFFFSVVLTVGLFLGGPLLAEGLGWIPLGLRDFLGVAAFPLPALGIFVAVTRHGLFDIDRIVSRTVSYAVIGLVVAVVYVVPVVVLPEVFRLSSDLAVDGATLAAAAVFNPLRRRVHSVVARRFDRERYDAERVVAEFSGRLQSAVDLGRVTDELGRAVGEALRPAAVALWVAEPSSRRAAR
jgi:hypothetical protein